MKNLGNHIDYYINEFSKLLLEDRDVSGKKTAFYDFIKEIKGSKFLILEYLIYKNLKNKTIKNEALVEDYIKDNVNKLSEYSLDDMLKEHEKLTNFNIDNIDNKDINNDIHHLITESLKSASKRNLSKYYQSLDNVASYIKEPKDIKSSYDKNLIKENKYPTEYIVEKANKVFNERYNFLNEDEKKWLQLFNESITKEVKKEILDNFKTTAKDFINENYEKSFDNEVKDLFQEAIGKIESIELENDDFQENFLEIHNLIS